LPLAKGAQSLSLSNALLWRSATDKELPEFDFPSWVDVRDVAKAHLAALEKSEAAGKRYILSAASTNYAEVRSRHVSVSVFISDTENERACCALDCGYCPGSVSAAEPTEGNAEGTYYARDRRMGT
jgi:nucleoside-diphosphate-sugar epimerase